MLYSKSLLNRYISLHKNIQEISNELILKSCEVEEIIERTIPDLVVIGKVSSIKPHPNADKLIICQLDCGSKGTYQICTGAINVEVDSYVPVALPGTHLPAINLTIEPREMRGEKSHGMICSKEELGIGGDAGEHRIWTLQGNHLRTEKGFENNGKAGDFNDIEEKDCGVSLGDKYPRLCGWTINVENKTITHRPDMFGHLGLAFELNTIFPKDISFQRLDKLKEKMQIPHILQLLEHVTPTDTVVSVQSPYVASYLTVDIKNVSLAPSTFYTKLIVEDIGLNPKSNRVDFSNLFMVTTGQPVHFFDADKISGSITVRQATDGEHFVDLFNIEHILQSTDIVIADDSKILALAGIIGSNNSGIDSTTKNILVEIAHFDPVIVRKTGTRLGLRTDAEIRFEKYINPFFSLASLELLLDELEYAKPSLGSFEIGGVSVYMSSDTNHTLQATIPYNPSRIFSYIYGSEAKIEGFPVTCREILTNLGFLVGEETVKSPIRRGPDDCQIEVDIIEEVSRIIGFNDIEEKILIDEISHKPFEQIRKRHRNIEDVLSHDFAMNQIETYPWLDKRRLSYEDDETLLKLKNPLDPDAKALRPTMFRSMIEIIEKNGPFFHSIRLFDIGKTWIREREKAEHDCLGCIVWNKERLDTLDHPLLIAKGAIKSTIKTIGGQGKIDFIPSDSKLGHPKQQATILFNTTPIGSIITVHPSVLQTIKLPETGLCVIAEIDITQLLSLIPIKKKQSYSYETLQDQIIQRDLNFIVDQESDYGTVIKAVEKCKEVSFVDVFDLYQGKSVPDNKKTIGLRLTIQGDGSFTNQTINEIMNKAISNAEGVGATLRG